MLKALALALPAITGVFCFAIVLQALQAKGLGPAASIEYMVLSVPSAVYVALPLSAVLVTTLIYGRLAADNEIMACRASGIPVSSLVWPSMLLALIGAGLTLGLAAWPLPESTYAGKKVSLDDAENLFFSQLSSGKFTFREAGFQMTVDRLVGNELYGLTILHRGLNGQTTYVYAPVGRAEFDNDRRRVTLTLRDSTGEIVRVEPARAAAATGTAPAATATDKASGTPRRPRPPPPPKARSPVSRRPRPPPPPRRRRPAASLRRRSWATTSSPSTCRIPSPATATT